MQWNMAKREVTLKVVYYGPALSGKTTNLQALHAMAPRGNAGRLMTLETRDDRTLFFDLLPVFFKTDTGYKVKIKLFTVPGQVIHLSTRRVVLQGADAIAFIADSQLKETAANKQAFSDLRANMTANSLPADLPLIIQFNKRDLPDVRSEEEIVAFESRQRGPVTRAVAINGEGVRETLELLLGNMYDDLQARHHLADRLGLDRAGFLGKIFDKWRAARPLTGGSW